MQNIAGLVASPITVEIGERTYTISPIPSRDYALIEKRILETRGDPIAIVRELSKDASPEERKALFEKAYQDSMYGNMVSSDEYERYAASHHGYRHIFWLGLRIAHPEITEEQAASLADQFFAERLELIGRADLAQQFLSFIMGMPEGNPSGPATVTTPEPVSESSITSGSDGSDTSPLNTDGPTAISEP